MYNHVGVGVTDIDAAIDWYQKVFGFKLVYPAMTVKNDGSANAKFMVASLGDKFQEVKIAHLATDNNVGLELFQFVDPEEVIPAEPEYWHSGAWHLSIAVPDVLEAWKKIEENGGKILMTKELYEAEGYAGMYTQDPWGTIIEVVAWDYPVYKVN